MELTTWLSLVAICAAGAMSPGPSLGVIIQIAARRGRWHGVLAAIAHGVGVGCYALITALGLAVLMLGAPLLFSGLKVLGALFLIYLGAGALFPRGGQRAHAELATAGALRSLGAGFMVAFLNPKLMIFFLALFSQFVEPGASWQQKLVLVVTPAAIDGFWYSVVAIAATQPWLVQRFAPWGPVLQRVFGGLLILLGLQVLWLALW